MRATISLSGELRWFLSCLNEEVDYSIPAGFGRPIVDFLVSLGAMAETIDRRLTGHCAQLTLAVRCIAVAFRTLSETDDGAPRNALIPSSDLPQWRSAIGNAIALAAAAEADLGGSLIFLNRRPRDVFARSTPQEGVAP